MASTLKINTLTGVTTAGSIQLQSRGSDDQAFTDVDHFGVQIAGDLA